MNSQNDWQSYLCKLSSAWPTATLWSREKKSRSLPNLCEWTEFFLMSTCCVCPRQAIASGYIARNPQLLHGNKCSWNLVNIEPPTQTQTLRVSTCQKPSNSTALKLKSTYSSHLICHHRSAHSMGQRCPEYGSWNLAACNSPHFTAIWLHQLVTMCSAVVYSWLAVFAALSWAKAWAPGFLACLSWLMTAPSWSYFNSSCIV